MIIALFPKLNAPQATKLAIEIYRFLSNQNMKVFIEDDFAHDTHIPPISRIDLQSIHLMISLGGDGTILRLIQQYPQLDIPVLGINAGHLGFMADVQVDDVYDSLTDLIQGKYTVEERMMLEAKTIDRKNYYAINDIVIHRASNPSLIKLSVHSNAAHVNTFEADGIVCATPNGSTAYSLAAGGPIVSPLIEATIITPISPHTISNRSIVLSADDVIEVKNLKKDTTAEVYVDGFSSFHLSTQQSFHIEKSKKKFKLINLKKRNYFSILRTKLIWSGKLR